MTDHPLTDAKCRDIANNLCFRWPPHVDQGEVLYAEDDMRAAADWQLEQVIEWLKDHLDVMSYVWADDVTAWGIDVESVIVDLKQAMRPTTTQEENQ